MTGADVHGPIDFLVLQCPSGADVSDTADALRDLVDGGTVRLHDFVAVAKDDSGTCSDIGLSAVLDEYRRRRPGAAGAQPRRTRGW